MRPLGNPHENHARSIIALIGGIKDGDIYGRLDALHAIAAPSLMGSAVASADDRRPTNIIRRARTVQQTRAGKQ